jgi:hypothetical protein
MKRYNVILSDEAEIDIYDIDNDCVHIKRIISGSSIF